MVLEPPSSTRHAGGARAGGRGGDVEDLRLELGTDLVVPSIVRERLHRWLDALGWGPDESEDVVLAVHEAVANVIDHAYRPAEPGRMRVTAHLTVLAARTRGRIEVRVRDWGRWRPVPAEPRYRGLGLRVMQGCMQTVEITRGVGGTEVRMVSAIAPLGDRSCATARVTPMPSSPPPGPSPRPGSPRGGRCRPARARR